MNILSSAQEVLNEWMRLILLGSLTVTHMIINLCLTVVCTCGNVQNFTKIPNGNAMLDD